MPADYGSRLSPRELNDLVSLLISVARQDKSGPDTTKKASRTTKTSEVAAAEYRRTNSKEKR